MTEFVRHRTAWNYLDILDPLCAVLPMDNPSWLEITGEMHRGFMLPLHPVLDRWLTKSKRMNEECSVVMLIKWGNLRKTWQVQLPILATPTHWLQINALCNIYLQHHFTRNTSNSKLLKNKYRSQHTEYRPFHTTQTSDPTKTNCRTITTALWTTLSFARSKINETINCQVIQNLW
jgi:hypothetical protein